MPRVHIHDIETRIAGSQCGIAVPAAYVRNVAPGHSTGLCRIVARHWHIRYRQHRQAGITVGYHVPVVHQFNGRQGPVRVDRIDHDRVAVLIFDIPQASLVVGQHIRARVDIAFLGSHYRPSTFRFDAPHRGHRVRHPMPHPITVRYLIKPVSRGDRADLHRFK